MENDTTPVSLPAQPKFSDRPLEDRIAIIAGVSASIALTLLNATMLLILLKPYVYVQYAIDNFMGK